MGSLQFGKVQLRIMRVLWEKGRANACEITKELYEIAPIAHSTVQTLLRGLEQKGAIAHDIDYRTFIYYPLIKEKDVKRYAMREFINHIFSGSPGNLVSFLIKEKHLTPEELKKICELTDDKEE